MSKIKVLVVDDSALMRRLLVEFLTSDPAIEVVGSAPDPIIARDKIKQLNPDVLTLDVEMPRMDGLTFLENLMRLRPMPVVMVSSLTERGAETTLQALELGAVDFVTKPKIDLEAGIRQYADELVAKIKSATRARVRAIDRGGGGPKPLVSRKLLRTTEKIIAIGASTGGTEAIKDVLERMPADAPAILITQHIPAAFSGPFAARMDRSSSMRVCEARHGQQVVPGHAYIAPGDWHLELARDGARYVCRLHQRAPENRHRPSVDVLLKSMAQYAGANAVAAILTGMGDDGARGLLAMREAGARTLVQDEASSVVWGMPGAAFKLGAAEQVLPLARMAEALLELSAGCSTAAARAAHGD
ncbi:protein-glutamate methylesterase/protein-glutamine glutaminase [Panacagrimonas sp.]|uniref:protein-glutamate methylesterase/protein-glutamine glutaminase n=1 Tax=Panacagrimonas sp. TaxID=2480088 RepID=UPI003B52E1E7